MNQRSISRQPPKTMYTQLKYSLPLFVLLHCFDALQFSPPTYTRTDDVTGESLICEQCRPGTHLKKHCTKDSKTECAPCPSSHYTEIWNYIDKCLYCNVYCTENQFEKIQCSNVTNRACACNDGFHMKHGSCYKHARCPPGEGVVALGAANKDVKCERCPEDHYSSQYSSTEACKKFSVCSDGHTTIPGNKQNDVFCSTCKNGTKTSDKDVCADQLLEFMKKQVFLPRKLLRLKSLLKRHAKIKQDLPVPELIEIIRRLDLQRSSIVIVDILKRIEPRLENKVKKWFDLESL